MKIMERIAAWQQAADDNPDLYTKLQIESVAAVIGGLNSNDWKKFMSHFHSNKEQLQRLLGEDNLNPKYKDKVLAYIGSSGTCGGGTRMSLALNMPDLYKAALDSASLPTDVRDDAEVPMVKLPDEIETFLKMQGKKKQ